MKWLKIFLTITLAALPVSQSFAVASDAMIEGAKLCTRHLPRFEREYAIPTHLLSAIASTESGRYHEGLGMKLPWPWAINANGKGYWFDSKEEAMAAVRKLHAHGVQSIDVGCMQVNLYQHPEAFASLSQAFEPQANIAYAASFLRNLYDEGGTWKKAAANYHSRTPSLGKEYVGLVYESWYTIIDKLRAARLQVPESSVAAMNELKKPTHAVAAAATPPRVVHVAAREPAPFEHPRMNSIKITSESDAPPPDNRQASILMIPTADSVPQPAQAQAPLQASEAKVPEIKTADSTPLQPGLQTPVQTLAANPATGHTMDASAGALGELNPAAGRRVLQTTTDQRSGPNFIFND